MQERHDRLPNSDFVSKSADLEARWAVLPKKITAVSIFRSNFCEVRARGPHTHVRAFYRRQEVLQYKILVLLYDRLADSKATKCLGGQFLGALFLGGSFILCLFALRSTTASFDGNPWLGEKLDRG